MKKLMIITLSLLSTLPHIAYADQNLVELLKNARPSVVLIHTYDRDNNLLKRGSGFFISAEGDLITNKHVVEGAYSATAKLITGEQYPVEGISAMDADHDIVKLRVKADKKIEVFLKLSNDIPLVGEDVVVVGNPLGLESTVSVGIISAVRQTPKYGKIVQISAPISPGSSGSPVMNMKGQVIGIATLTMKEGQALNFAIPSELILNLTTVDNPIKLSQFSLLPPAIQWIPQDALVVLEVTRPKELLEALTNDKAASAVKALPFYKQQTSNPKFQDFLEAIKIIEEKFGTDWRSGLGTLTGGGITLALCPEDTMFLIIDSEDEQMLERFDETFLKVALSEKENKDKFNLVASQRYDNLTAWMFNRKETHKVIGRRLIFANHPEKLKNILQYRFQTSKASVVANPAYNTVKQTVSSDAVARVFVNLKSLMDNPQAAQIFRKQPENPLAALAFAGIIEATRDSNWLALGLHIEDNTLVFRASVDSRTVPPTSHAAFALPKKPAGAFPNLSVPHRIAALSLYRDLHQFYSAKDELFPGYTSGFAIFENIMGMLFSGRNLTTKDVLAETGPEIRFVVAEQDYDPAIGIPQIKYPAFAAVMRLKNPEQFNQVAKEAWQKALGSINLSRLQKAMQIMIIENPVHKDTQFTMAYFPATGTEDKNNLDQKFNFRPALAMPGEYLILSSTDALARDLIDTINQEKQLEVKPIAETNSLIEIDIAQLASILQANRDALVRSGIVSRGRTQQEAEADIDIIITLVKLLDSAMLSLSTHDSLTQAHLEIKLNL